MIDGIYHLNMMLLIYIFFLIIVLSFYYVRRRYNYWNERGIDGPKPTFPFGYTLDKARYDPFDLEIKWLKSYGKLYGVYTGLLPTLIVSDPDLIKQIFVKDFQSFNNRRILNSYHEVWNLNLFSSEYTPWKHYRSMTTPAFSTGKLRSMNPLIERCIQKLFNSLDIVDQFEPKSEFTQFSIDITSASFFATDTGSNPIISQRCLELVDIPAWRSGMVGALPRTILNLFGIESVFRPKALNFIVQLLRTIVEQQRQLAPYQQNDFIRLLIEQNGLKTPPLTDNEVVAQSLIFFLASYEQIASVMTYCSYELAMNQDIQQRLVEELNKIDLSDLEQIVNNVAYLEAIIDESLRKYPPELRMERRVSSQQLVSLDQYNVQLEPDTLIEVPTIALHHNEEYFPQPDKFDPERFSLENRNQIVPYTFIPFGIGPRNCIGTRFAYRVIKICLAQLILRYRLEITPKTPSKLTFKSGNLSLLIPEFNLSICKRNLNKF